MTINYCDFLNGDDSTGDGTHGNPYKTITHSSTGLTGGDEVRCAKSPDNSNLTGILSFVDGSDSITTSVNLTGEIIIGDFISKSLNSEWCEVIAINSTTLTLYKKYYGTTENVAGKKLGVTSTGESAYNEHIQDINSSGLSVLSKLKISGGWVLSSQVQTGNTFFRQMHSTFLNRYGYGLFASNKNYLEIEKLGFLRYRYGFYLGSSNNYNDFENIKIYNCSSYGFYLESTNYYNNFNSCISNNNLSGIYCYTGNNNTINNQICNNNANYGIRIDSLSNNNLIENPICNYNGFCGIWLDNSHNNTLNNCICNNTISAHNPNGHGIRLYHSNYNIINTATCNNNGQFGIQIYQSYDNILNDITCNENKIGIFLVQLASFKNVINNIICNDNTQNGIDLTFCDNNIINNIICNDNTQNGISFYESKNNIINKYYGNGNGNVDINLDPNDLYFQEIPVSSVQHYKTVGDNRILYINGIIYRDTINARSIQCLKFTPTSNTYYISQKFNFAVLKEKDDSFSFYIKDDAAFDGDVQVALYFMEEKISGWTEISTTEIYTKQIFNINGTWFTEMGVVEIRIKVRGTAGNVYVDDFNM